MDAFTYRDGQLFCEDVAVDEVAKAAGTPIYVYSRATFETRYRALADAFAEVAPTICFSVKSCSNLAVLKVLHDLGSGFDVVSGGELFRVQQAEGEPKKVVFAGVGKTDAEIAYALDLDILMFNVESAQELENIDRLALQLGKAAPVAIRINPDVDPKTHRHTTTGKKENKFGVDLAIADRLVERLHSCDAARLVGVHVHIGSPVNEVQPYAEALDKALAFADRHATENVPIPYINVGGGFGLLYRAEEVPAFSDYAAAIVPRVRKAGRKLVLEPGRCIAGNAGILVGTVQYVKSNGEKTFAVLDAGMNDLIRPALYEAYHSLWPVRASQPPIEHREPGTVNPMTPTMQLKPTDVVGPICESADCFAKARPIPPVRRGDRMAIFSAGAYGFTMASTYNSRPRAAEVLVEGDRWRIVRERETWQDLIAKEKA